MNEINLFKDEYEVYSNFYPCIIIFEDIEYPTLEHAYQAAKTLDQNIRKKISMIPASQAGKAKRLGSKVKLRPNWELIKLTIMKNLLIQKFSKEPFKSLLLNTYDIMIIEGNYWHDNYWGDCYCSKCQDIVGQNNLGKLIMKIRRIIK